MPSRRPRSPEHAARLHRFEASLLEAVSKGRPLRDVMAMAALGIQRLIPDSLASIHLLTADGLRLQSAVAPDLPAAYVEAFTGLPIGPATGSCGTAAYRGEAVVVTDIAADPLWDGYREAALPHGLRACWSTPVTDSEGKVRATFAIYHRQPHTPRPEETGLTQGAARILGIAIDKDQRELAVAASDARMRGMFEGAAFGMAILDPQGRYMVAPAKLSQPA